MKSYASKRYLKTNYFCILEIWKISATISFPTNSLGAGFSTYNLSKCTLIFTVKQPIFQHMYVRTLLCKSWDTVLVLCSGTLNVSFVSHCTHKCKIHLYSIFFIFSRKTCWKIYANLISFAIRIFYDITEWMNCEEQVCNHF